MKEQLTQQPQVYPGVLFLRHSTIPKYLNAPTKTTQVMHYEYVTVEVSLATLIPLAPYPKTNSILSNLYCNHKPYAPHDTLCIDRIK